MLQPKVIDLNTLVKDMEKLLRRLIGEHIEMSTLLKAELGQVEADPGQIEQVLFESGGECARCHARWRQLED